MRRQICNSKKDHSPISVAALPRRKISPMRPNCTDMLLLDLLLWKLAMILTTEQLAAESITSREGNLRLTLQTIGARFTREATQYSQ